MTRADQRADTPRRHRRHIPDDMKPGDAYIAGHRDRYRRDREPDILCRNCGRPWAIEAAAEPAAAEPQRFTIHRASPSDRIVPAAEPPTDQRADTPRTAAGRELLDDPTVLLMRESAASGGEILGINEGELELHILAIEAEAAAEPAAAEPPDLMGAIEGNKAPAGLTPATEWISLPVLFRLIRESGSPRGVTPALHTTGTDESAEPQRYVGVTPALDVERLAKAVHKAFYRRNDDDEDDELPSWKNDLENSVEWYESPNGMAQRIAAEYARLGSPEDSD